ncbi:MAG TPA: ATP-binding protein [Chthonomonadaceae bacterium]|nr:ATP-binding protein [Chthonomonadaceae bacterium]
MDDKACLQQQIEQLQKELSEARKELLAARQKIDEMERDKAGAVPEVVGDPAIPITEFEETLKRLVQRIAMILQAEKCVIMIRDRDSEDLIARSPAFGISEDEVKQFRVDMDSSLSGSVFRAGEPIIFHNTDEILPQEKDLFRQLRVRNGVTVPLFIEKRDDQNRIVDRIMIGVLHCFNKRYSGEFIEEDVRLLERLSRNAAAVIANAQAFQEVYEERQKLVHTLESLTAGLILVNQHERIGQMNAQARAMFGVEKGVDPIGKPLEEIVQHEQCLQIIRRKLAEAQNPEPLKSEEEEEERRSPDEISIQDQYGEEYIYQVHAAGVHDDTNQLIGTVIIFNDITDIRNLERMKTEFVSIVSHELRTPLTPMKGFVRTLLDDENEEWYTREDRREFYGIIETNVDRLSRLINDLLNVSRIEKKGVEGIEMNFEEVDVREAAEEVVHTQRGMTDKHTLVIDFEPEHIVAESDVDKIQNILQNLVSNAIKYSPEGGEVRIIGRLEADQGTVLLGVKDQGLGIPEAAQKKLFGKFERVERKGTGSNIKGTGIGLFLVKNLVLAHKGHIWVESEVGKGSTFWFRIPLKQPKPEAGEADAESK